MSVPCSQSAHDGNVLARRAQLDRQRHHFTRRERGRITTFDVHKRESTCHAATSIFSLCGSGRREPITFSQLAGEQLQRHVVTDQGRNRIVAGTFVTKKSVRV